MADAEIIDFMQYGRRANPAAEEEARSSKEPPAFLMLAGFAGQESFYHPFPGNYRLVSLLEDDYVMPHDPDSPFRLA